MPGQPYWGNVDKFDTWELSVGIERIEGTNLYVIGLEDGGCNVSNSAVIIVVEG